MPDLTPLQTVGSIIGLFIAGGGANKAWDTIFGARGRKVDETEMITRLSAAFREEMREENRDLRLRMSQVFRVLNRLTDAVDDFLMQDNPESAAERKALRAANNEAKTTAP